MAEVFRENQPLNSPRQAPLQVKAAKKTTAATRPAEWLWQYRQLQEQAQQLEAACVAHAVAGGGRDAGRDATAPAALSQLRVQLGRQVQAALNQLEAIRSACRQPSSDMRGLERRLTQFEGSLGSLQSLCAEQLQQLAQREAAAGADTEAAARALQLAVAEEAVMQPAATTALLGAAAFGSASGPPAAAAAAQPERAKCAAQPELPEEVRDCDEFLQRHGPTGGWHPDEHAEFERILKSCHGNYSHAVRISLEQLGLLHSREDIIRHARWHEELQDLQLKKRQAIQRWRMERAARQVQLLQQEPAQEAPDQDLVPARPGRRDSAAAQRQRAQQKQDVLEWKRSREERQSQQQQQEQDALRQQRERERQARQARQEELARLLASYKQRKVEEYEQKARAAEHPPLSRFSTSDPEAQQRVAERSQQLLAKRQELARRRTSQAQEREARVRQLQEQASAEFAPVEREPSRVLQATSAAQLRQLAAMAEERGSRDSGWIRHVQHRSTPSWRQGNS